MKYLKVIWREGKLAVVALACWLAIHGAVLAAVTHDGREGSEKGRGGPEGGSYVLSYTIAIVCIGVGVLFVCRSSRRRDRARPEEFTNLFRDDGEVSKG
jgi:hypothetical protein